MALTDYTTYPFPQDNEKTNLNFVDGNDPSIFDDDVIGSGSEVTSGADYILFTNDANIDVPTITGASGDDFIEVDTTNQDEHADNILGSWGNDTIIITGGIDNGSATSIVNGDADSDFISIDYGHNTAGSENDIVRGDSGNDVIEITAGSNMTIDGGTGDDVLSVKGGVHGDEWTDGYIANPQDHLGNPLASGNDGFIYGGAGSDIIFADGSTELMAIEAYGDQTAGTGGYADTWHLTTGGGDDVYYLGDFSDNGTDNVFDSGVDDILYINGELFDWSVLSDGNISSLMEVSSLTNVTHAGDGGEGIRIQTTDNSVIDISNLSVACFVTGTLINTTEGQKAIESLSIGDSVCTTDGQLETIKWIGKRAVAARFAGSHSQPICIQAGALAQGTPARDLYVSPDHALFIDGVLVQAQALVNGSTITQVEMTADFTYYHIELDRHALIFAEGAETETFVDAQARGKFDNAAEFEALYPTAKAVANMPYPRVKAKRQLPAAIKAKLKQVKTA